MQSINQRHVHVCRLSRSRYHRREGLIQIRWFYKEKKKRNPSEIPRRTCISSTCDQSHVWDQTSPVSATLCAERLYVCVRGVDKARRAEKRPSSVTTTRQRSRNPHNSRGRRRKKQEGSASDMKTAAHLSPVFTRELCTCTWLCSALWGSTLARARAHTHALVLWSKHTGGGKGRGWEPHWEPPSQVKPSRAAAAQTNNLSSYGSRSDLFSCTSVL